MGGARRSNGAFASAYTDQELRGAVRATAALAAARPPWTLTQAQFDALRELAAGAACPAARQVQRRLGQPWRQLLRATLDAPAPADVATGAGARHGPWSRAECVQAVDDALAWADGKRLTTSLYREWCAKQPGRPWPRSLARWGGLPALVEAAQHHQCPPVVVRVERMLVAARTNHLSRLLLLDALTRRPFTVTGAASALRLPYSTVSALVRALRAVDAVLEYRPDPAGPRRYELVGEVREGTTLEANRRLRQRRLRALYFESGMGG